MSDRTRSIGFAVVLDNAAGNPPDSNSRIWMTVSTMQRRYDTRLQFLLLSFLVVTTACGERQDSDAIADEQIDLAQEQSDADPIARYIGNSGFIEGWARYSKTLAAEMGLYSSTVSSCGRVRWSPTAQVNWSSSVCGSKLRSG